MSWKGAFVDAYKTWYLRRDPQAEILAKKTHSVQPLIWINSKTPAKLKFTGYKRLPQGTVLMYRGKGFTVKEIIKPVDSYLQREIHISAEEKASGMIKINGVLKPLKSGVYKEEMK